MPGEPDHSTVDWVAFGQRLAQRRRELRLAQDELADAAGISRVQLQNIEHGLSDRAARRPLNPRLQTLLALCRELNLRVTFDFSQPGRVSVEWEPREVSPSAEPADVESDPIQSPPEEPHSPLG